MLIDMARKTKVACKVGEKRFTVVVVNGHASDSHAGRSFESAMKLAQPDRGSLVEVYVTCAKDAGAARLPYHFHNNGKLVRRFRTKKGG